MRGSRDEGNLEIHKSMLLCNMGRSPQWSIMKLSVWRLQLALLRWLTSQTEEDRMALTAVTAVQLGRELLNRITGQDKVEAYKVPAGSAVCVWEGGFDVTNLFFVCLFRESVFWALHSSSVSTHEPRRLTSKLKWRKEFWFLLLKSELWRGPPYSE